MADVSSVAEYSVENCEDCLFFNNVFVRPCHRCYKFRNIQPNYVYHGNKIFSCKCLYCYIRKPWFETFKACEARKGENLNVKDCKQCTTYRDEFVRPCPPCYLFLDIKPNLVYHGEEILTCLCGFCDRRRTFLLYQAKYEGVEWWDDYSFEEVEGDELIKSSWVEHGFSLRNNTELCMEYAGETMIKMDIPEEISKHNRKRLRLLNLDEEDGDKSPKSNAEQICELTDKVDSWLDDIGDTFKSLLENNVPEMASLINYEGDIHALIKATAESVRASASDNKDEKEVNVVAPAKSLKRKRKSSESLSSQSTTEIEDDEELIEQQLDEDESADFVDQEEMRSDDEDDGKENMEN